MMRKLDPRTTQRLTRLLQMAEREMEAAKKRTFRYESPRKWRLSILRHRIGRIKQALGLRASHVQSKPYYRAAEAAKLLCISTRTLHR